MRISRSGTFLSFALTFGAASAAWASDIVAAERPLPAGAARVKAAFPGTQIALTDGRVAAFYGKPMTAAESPAAAVDAWWATYGDAFGVDKLELELAWNAESTNDKFSFYGYRQLMDGLPVELGIARVLVLNGDPFRVVRVGGVLAPRPAGGFAPDTLTGDQALLSVAGLPASLLRAHHHDHAGWLPDSNSGSATLSGTVGERLTDWELPELVVFAGDPASTPGDDPVRHVPFNSIEPIRAWKLEGYRPDLADHDRFTFFVNAANGELVFVRNEKHHVDVSGTVQGKGSPGMLPDIASNPPVVMNMPEIRVNITGGSNAFTNRNGAYTITHGGTAQVTLTSNVSGGRWVDVNDQGGTEMSLSQPVTPPGPGNLVFNDVPSQFTTAQVNGFVHTNYIHNFMTDRTTWTGLDVVVPCNVNINSSCNAFYSGGTINFYRLAGSCNNTAYSGVVAHEYGHLIVANLGLSQGAFGEGFGDSCAVLLYDDPVLGRFFTISGGSVRDYSTGLPEDPYPCSPSCGGQVHCCGETLGGTWRDIREQLGAANGSAEGLAIAQDLFVAWSQVTAGGQGANSAHPVTLTEILSVDDNDGDLANGTPNYPAICAATAAHNLVCPAVSLIGFEFPDGIPSTVTPNVGATIRVNVVAISSTPTPGSGTITYRVNGGSWTTTPMAQGAPNQYTATLPAIACGSVANFYFTSGSADGNVSFPANAPASWRSVVAGTGTTVVMSDNMETNSGWSVGPGDTAQTGIWTRVDPVGTAAQPEDDHTAAPGVFCWVTGQGTVGGSLGANDVDGGRTHLVSPTLNLAGQNTATVEYWRWYSNAESTSNPNDDVFRVEVSNNNGSSWVTAEIVGPSGPETEPGWFFKSWSVADYITPTSTVRVRFIAEDAGAGGSVVEAAIDDFRVTVVDCSGPSCPGDLDGDNDVDLNDLSTLLANFGTASGAGLDDGDLDSDGDVDLNDLSTLLAAFGTTC